MESNINQPFFNLSSSYNLLIDKLKRKFSIIERNNCILAYQTSYGETIYISDENGYFKAIEEIINRKIIDKTIIKFYLCVKDKYSNDNIKEEKTSFIKEETTETDKTESLTEGEKTLISNSNNNSSFLNAISTDKDKVKTKPKKRLRKNNEGPFKITRNHSIPKRAAKRDLIQGKQKYLIANLDRYKRYIPRLAKSRELSNKITEWFLLSKPVLRTTLASIKHPRIKRLNAFFDFIPEHTFRIRFQYYTRELNKRLKKNTKSFSFYESGVDRMWSLEEGKERMSNFMDFATRHIEVINGPISLKDF